ncbi:hypothetical protein FUAX_30300 [Fulvitalea axinellae]|uniref:50S ribosomal protein L29 n=1 Tax=Fulvitalea axinellae TaxID=1182444 RepID=A0AAU9D3Q8_9BACT|nr:hypothetical protein FUAX_30300 [Fulvitalea axinellae]
MEKKSLVQLKNRRRELKAKLATLKTQLDADLVIHAFRNNHLALVTKYRNELAVLDRKIRNLGG